MFLFGLRILYIFERDGFLLVIYLWVRISWFELFLKFGFDLGVRERVSGYLEYGERKVEWYLRGKENIEGYCCNYRTNFVYYFVNEREIERYLLIDVWFFLYLVVFKLYEF